ncbi:MAG: helix-turn-helix domain-containing protein [Bacteroidia bacterium]
MFYFAGVIITFFLAFILSGKKNKSSADKILFSWLVVIGVHLSLFYLNYSEIIFSYPHLLGVIAPFPLLHGPFIYLYTAALTGQEKKWREYIFHFLPAFIMAFCFSGFYMLPGSEKIIVYANKGSDYKVLLLINSVLIKISGIAYVLLAYKLLIAHKKRIVNQFSTTDKINLYWLRYLILGVALVWIFVLAGHTQLLFFAAVVFVILIGYFGIRHVSIFTGNSNLQREIPDAETGAVSESVTYPDKQETPKYDKSGLTDEMASEIHQKLRLMMEQEQLFVNPELTLTELAQKLNVNQNNLSQVINTYEQKSFYEYINELRINKFISMAQLPDNRKLTILALAYDCGFNSKSSFNKHFKRITNQTPSAFINSLY